jgi:peptidase E
MKGITKVMTLMNFQDSNDVSARVQLFQDELDWVFLKTGTLASEALFIPYAYKGTNYTSYFKDLSYIFSTKGIKLTDITSGNPANLIAAAQIIVIGGGDITTFLSKMNSLVTPVFNPYTAIKSRVDTGIPYIGWNEGSAVCSPKYFNPPSTVLSPGINASPFQIVTNYTNPAQSRNDIKNYLQANPSISKAICLVNRPDGSSVRLEDSGGGILSIPSDPYPYIINYEIVNGNLQES